MGVTNYIWDVENDSYLMETDETDTTTVVYSNEPRRYGGLISQRRGGAISHFHFDGRSSTAEITDISQSITGKWLYDGFGNIVQATGMTSPPFLYVGQYGYYSDAEVGLIYARRRPYAPRLGRWVSIVRFQSRGSLSVYVYAFNKVMRLADPAGRSRTEVFSALTAAAAPAGPLALDVTPAAAGLPFPPPDGKQKTVAPTCKSCRHAELFWEIIHKGTRDGKERPEDEATLSIVQYICWNMVEQECEQGKPGCCNMTVTRFGKCCFFEYVGDARNTLDFIKRPALDHWRSLPANGEGCVSRGVYLQTAYIRAFKDWDAVNAVEWREDGEKEYKCGDDGLTVRMSRNVVGMPPFWNKPDAWTDHGWTLLTTTWECCPGKFQVAFASSNTTIVPMPCNA